MWLGRGTTFIFYDVTLLRDVDHLFRHDATWFRVQGTLLLPGNTLFRHENTCFRGGVMSFRTGSTCPPRWIQQSRDRGPTRPYLASVSSDPLCEVARPHNGLRLRGRAFQRSASAAC